MMLWGRPSLDRLSGRFTDGHLHAAVAWHSVAGLDEGLETLSKFAPISSHFEYLCFPIHFVSGVRRGVSKGV
jgi:hypothetical protein